MLLRGMFTFNHFYFYSPMSAYATVVTVMVLQITGSIKKLCSLFWEWVLCLDLRSGSKKEKKTLEKHIKLKEEV